MLRKRLLFIVGLLFATTAVTSGRPFPTKASTTGTGAALQRAPRFAAVFPPISRSSAQEMLTIGQIQGSGEVSPFVGERVSFRGVVTGMYEDRNSRGITFYTLFVQDIPGTADGVPATSDGIAVFLGRKRPSFQPGDQVQVSGRVPDSLT